MAEAHVDVETYFVNTLFQSQPNTCYRINKKRWCELREYADIWMEILQEQLEYERYLRLNPPRKPKNCVALGLYKPNGSVFNGSAGLALLDMFLAQTFSMPPEDKEALLQRAQNNLRESLRNIKGLRMSFLGGDAGPIALAIVFYSRKVAQGCPCECTVINYLNKLLQFQKNLLSCNDDIPNEILCGRAGYLWALLFVNKHFPCLISKDSITQAVISLVCAGKPCGKMRRKYLMYNWKDKPLLGAAHGLHGILYVLLKAKDYWPEEIENDAEYQFTDADAFAGSQMCMEDKVALQKSMCWGQVEGGDFGPRSRRERVGEWVLNTLEFLEGQIFSSGNTLAATGHSVDKYVNWAHGSSGAIYTFIEAHKVYQDAKYLNAALNCGKVTWERGLCKTGYGLAEGVAGNAYALMALYTYTKQEKFRERAVMFAEYCFNYGSVDDPCLNQQQLPHQPFSLFEGLPGVIYMLYDFTTETPLLPGYEL